MHKNRLRLSALIQKETSQLLRDVRNLLYMIGLPVIELFLFAYAVSLTVYHLPTAVADQSQTQQSRELIRAFINSQYFDYVLRAQDEDEVRQAINAGQVKAGIIIPPTSEAIERGPVDLSRRAEEVVAGLPAIERVAPVLWQIEPGLSAWASETQMRIVLTNLLGNAAKFTRRTSEPVVHLCSVLGADGHLAFQVRDNGAGFDVKRARACSSRSSACTRRTNCPDRA